MTPFCLLSYNDRVARVPSRINLFQYRDYRRFLRDWYAAAKKSRGSFSFRTFSKRAGFRSTNFFKLVMDGERNLTEKSVIPFMVGLNLNKQEQEFFRSLVFYNQADTDRERDAHYRRLLQSRKFSQLKSIEKRQYDYYSNWYHPVVRELVVSKECDGTPEWIAGKISPPITPAQVEKSIEILEALGFIEKTGPGKWRQASSLVSTGPEVVSHVVLNYHQNLLDLTKEVLETVPPTERDISTMTLGVVKGRIPELKKRVQEFRKEVLKMVSVDTVPEEVVQLSIQLFPLTRSSAKPKGRG